ncbi:MAG: hypothetical protein OYG31_00925 [Candidatus Kaiserbacteria bacterium]|nr:hypothetical protein [Candidatus Kaiserbacteria bacterium]
MKRGTKDRDDTTIQTHATWEFLEEKGTASKDKELLIGLLGITVIVIAILLNMYIFGALVAMATSMFLYIGRQQPKNLTFSITNIGLFMNNDFIPKEKISSYNIIDIPGDRARLIVQTEKIISMNEILPIYDVTMEHIEKAFRRINIKKNTSIEPNIIDIIASFV